MALFSASQKHNINKEKKKEVGNRLSELHYPLKTSRWITVSKRNIKITEWNKRKKENNFSPYFLLDVVLADFLRYDYDYSDGLLFESMIGVSEKERERDDSR